jgi:hypothetical protein
MEEEEHNFSTESGSGLKLRRKDLTLSQAWSFD